MTVSFSNLDYNHRSIGNRSLSDDSSHQRRQISTTDEVSKPEITFPGQRSNPRRGTKQEYYLNRSSSHSLERPPPQRDLNRHNSLGSGGVGIKRAARLPFRSFSERNLSLSMSGHSSFTGYPRIRNDSLSTRSTHSIHVVPEAQVRTENKFYIANGENRTSYR